MNTLRIYGIAIKRQFRLSNIITFGVLALLAVITNVFSKTSPPFFRVITSTMNTSFTAILIVRLIFVLKETNNHDMNKAIYLNYHSINIYVARVFSDFLLMFFGLLLITGVPIITYALNANLHVSGTNIGWWILFVFGNAMIYMIITVAFRFVQSSIKAKILRGFIYVGIILFTYILMLVIRIIIGFDVAQWQVDFKVWLFNNRDFVTFMPILNIITIPMTSDHIINFSDNSHITLYYEYWRVVPFIAYSLGAIIAITTLGASQRKTLLCA